MSEFGIERFVEDLSNLCYKDIEVMLDTKNNSYAIIKNYEIEFGRFAKTIIQLGILIPNDYPRSLMASIQVKSDPVLLDKSKVPNKYNIIDSPLGPEWRYWSNRFTENGNLITQNIMAQINGIFRNI